LRGNRVGSFLKSGLVYVPSLSSLQQWMEAAPGGASDWAAETTVGGAAGVGGAPIVASGGVPPPTTGGFDQDWNVTASTHTKDWADDEWGGAEPQPVVRSSSFK
jgi:hypothetical protein